MRRAITWTCFIPFLASMAACEDEPKTSAPKSRRDAVLSAAASPVLPSPKADTPPSQASAEPAVAAKPRQLCSALEDPGTTLGDGKISQRAATGSSEPSEDLEVGAGQWTWVNLWAAWCVPCKAEIPMLLDWQKQLDGKARFQFVAVDDDERQLQAFLDKQPESGLKATYWLREGKQREGWFDALGMDPDPELPAHVIFDDQGHKRCVVEGAVEPSDWQAVSKLLAGASP